MPTALSILVLYGISLVLAVLTPVVRIACHRPPFGETLAERVILAGCFVMYFFGFQLMLMCATACRYAKQAEGYQRRRSNKSVVRPRATILKEMFARIPACAPLCVHVSAYALWFWF